VGKKRQTWVLRSGGFRFEFGGQREGATGGRKGDAGVCCTGTENNIDEEEKGEKAAGNKKRGGEGRTRGGRKMEAEGK
jgi:hypothetical protein